MAIKISELPAASVAQLTDQKEVNQGDVSKKVTTQQDLDLFNANAQLEGTDQVTGLDTALSGKADTALSNLSSKPTALENIGMGAGYYSFSSAANVTLSNPLPGFINATFTTINKKLILPAMNDSNSMLKEGGKFTIVYNSGSQAFDACHVDGSTIVNIPADNIYMLVITSNATANGTIFPLPLTSTWNGLFGVIDATTDDLPQGSNAARKYYADALVATYLATIKNANNGIAGLDGSAQLALAQIPTLPQSQVTNLTSDLSSKCSKSANLSDVSSISAAKLNLGVPDTGGAAGAISVSGIVSSPASINAVYYRVEDVAFMTLDAASLTVDTQSLVIINDILLPPSVATTVVIPCYNPGVGGGYAQMWFQFQTDGTAYAGLMLADSNSGLPQGEFQVGQTFGFDKICVPYTLA